MPRALWIVYLFVTTNTRQAQSMFSCTRRKSSSSRMLNFQFSRSKYALFICNTSLLTYLRLTLARDKSWRTDKFVNFQHIGDISRNRANWKMLRLITEYLRFRQNCRNCLYEMHRRKTRFLPCPVQLQVPWVLLWGQWISVICMMFLSMIIQIHCLQTLFTLDH